MSFFGLENSDLENDKRKFLEGDLKEPENIAVYTWGEESYDGLGDALQEGGDELNDETFGGTGAVGKDFDFSNPTLPDDIDRSSRTETGLHHSELPKEQALQPLDPVQRQGQKSSTPVGRPSPAPRPGSNSLESIWDDKSPFSVLPVRTNGPATQQSRHPPGSAVPSRFSPFDAGNHDRQAPLALGAPASQAGVRTLQEIEAEMRVAAQSSRNEALQRERHQQQEALLQQQLVQQEILQRQQLEQQQLRLVQLRQEQELRQQQEEEEILLYQRRLREQEQELLLQRQQEEQELLRLQRLQLDSQQQLHLQQLQRLQQQQQQQQQQQHVQRDQYQHQRTPPPRMLPTSQSPRFHDHQQRQILLLQQQQEQQQQQRLLELQERLRLEDLERNMRSQLSLNAVEGHRRTPSGPTIADYQAAQLLQQQQQVQQQRLQQHQLQQQQQQQQQRRQRSQSPAMREPAYGNGPLQQGLPYLPQSIQLQQRLLSEMAQVEFLRDIQGGGTAAEQEALRAEAVRKILEAERMEEKRRRKAAKIAHMSRYNDLMTQSDKDFITRIQVSQLVTQDPFEDDYYAQVYGQILRSRMGLQAQDGRVLKFGSGGGVGLGLTQKGGGRRPNAMQRMEQQVERIVSNARKREEEKGLHSLHSLQGALGKTSGRSYKAAPRQLLQVDTPHPTSGSPTLVHAHAHISKDDSSDRHIEARKLGREALGTTADSTGVVTRDPLSHREVLTMIESLFDLVLQAEKLSGDAPPPEDEEAVSQWKSTYDILADAIFDGLHMNAALETSDPHPFVSLLGPMKGKRILSRISKLVSKEKMHVILTLIVACYGQLDVVKQAPLLDTLEDTEERAEIERQTQAFSDYVLPTLTPVVNLATLHLISGLLGLFTTHNDTAAVALSQPGLSLMTLFFSRVEAIKQASTFPSDIVDVHANLPSPEELAEWQRMYDHLFQLLKPQFLLLFPSTRLSAILPPDQTAPPGIHMDIIDQPTWRFLAMLALHASSDQQAVLVTTLRQKIFDNVVPVNKGWITDEEECTIKLRNVNVFLNAVGLDSSQLNV